MEWSFKLIYKYRIDEGQLPIWFQFSDWTGNVYGGGICLNYDFDPVNLQTWSFTVFPRMIQMKIFQLRHEIAQFRPFKISWICPKTQTQLPGISRHFVGHDSLLDLLLWFVSEGKYKIDTFIVYLWFWQYKKNFSFVTHALETKFARRNYIFF